MVLIPTPPTQCCLQSGPIGPLWIARGSILYAISPLAAVYIVLLESGVNVVSEFILWSLLYMTLLGYF